MKNLYAKAGIPIEKIEIIPNFLPELKFQKPKIEDVDGRQNSRMRLLFVGRISPEKGLDDLLIQFEKFNGQSDISIDIVGDGPLLHTLREKYSKVAGIKWHGQVASAEVQNLMSVCDFLVVPSLWFEGMPLVILEAFRSGLPVIANRIGNLAEIVKEGVNGYLVSPVRTDSVSPLSNDESVQFDWSSLFHFLKEKIGNSSPSAFQKELLELRRNSRNQFDQKYCEKVHLENLSRLYRSISKGLNP